MKNKITIAIPSHNNEKVILETLESAISQEYPLKEILIIDDASTDSTFQKCLDFKESHPKQDIRVLLNQQNLGIGHNLVRLMDETKTKYVVYLCSDDIFTNVKVCTDIVKIFDSGDEIGFIGRYYYQFMHGYSGAIAAVREQNILISACNPSGMAFRAINGIVPTSRIFVEMPNIVAQYLQKWRYTILEYDTIAARTHPGGNTGHKKSYYTQSPTKNWVDLIGPSFKFHQGFIQLKNRAPHLLWPEILLCVKINKKVLIDPLFWFSALISLIFPGFILRPLCRFWRHRITRKIIRIIERPGNVQ